MYPNIKMTTRKRRKEVLTYTKTKITTRKKQALT